MAQDKQPSARGLVDSDLGPLRKYEGILDSMPVEQKTSTGDKPRPYSQITFNVKDIDVREAVEPYPFPIASIIMNVSNKKKSRYGVFCISVTDILDMAYSKEQLDPSNPNYIPSSKRMDLADCVGKRMGFVLADGEEGRPQPPLLWDGRAVDETHAKGQEMPTPCWVCYMIEGIGSTGSSGSSPMDEAKKLLDGRTISQFNQAALANPIIRGDKDLLTAISAPTSSPTSFTTVMLSANMFSKDENGVYHKV
jgi:hypothetical protein